LVPKRTVRIASSIGSSHGKFCGKRRDARQNKGGKKKQLPALQCALLQLCGGTMNTSSEKTLFDFSNPTQQRPWVSIDDRIMGGFSESHTEFSDSGCLRFSGSVSLENRGGFASARSPADNYDLTGCRYVRLLVKGDGQRYKLGLRIDLYFDGVSYLTSFETTKDEWREITLPLDAFLPTHHGQLLSNAALLEPSQIRSFVLLISDRQEGRFQLELAWIKAA
jgi:monofunctional biosynthetic peptidoglycan transglycosylase